MFYRAAASAAVNPDEKGVYKISFSSDKPVLRSYGYEILDHSKVDLERLNGGAALLWNHKVDVQVGVIESASIDKEAARGEAYVRFSKKPVAAELEADVVAGIVRNVSVGYDLEDAEIVEGPKINGRSSYIFKNWKPTEISFVSIPADDSVGVGRMATRIAESFQSENTQPKFMATQIEETEPKPDTTKADTLRMLEIAEKNGIKTEVVRKHISDGKTLEQFRDLVIDHLASKPVNVATPIGLNENEAKRWSIHNAVRSIINKDKCFELEVSDSIARKIGVATEGFFIPQEAIEIPHKIDHRCAGLSATRDMSAGTGSLGGFTVATNLESAGFVELLRNLQVGPQLGVRTISGLKSNIDWPVQATATTSAHLTEVQSTTTSDITFAKITSSPKRAGVDLIYSKQLLLQSSLDMEQALRYDAATELALLKDRILFSGTGSGQPMGILNAAGLALVAIGTNGGPPTWSQIVGLETTAAIANAAIGNLWYVTTAAARGKLKQTLKTATDTASQMLWADSAFANGRGSLNGYNALASNQLPSNLVKGSSGAVCSAMVFGNFSDLLNLEWGALDVVVDQFTAAKTAQVKIVFNSFYDVYIRRIASFAATKDITTT